MHTREWPLAVVMLAGVAGSFVCRAEAAATGPASVVECYRLQAPDGKGSIYQGSSLCFGRLGSREGLWLVADRNGGPSANQIFFIDGKRLSQVRPEAPIVVDLAIAIVPPADGWDSFSKRHSGVAADVLSELKAQLESVAAGGPPLDLEALTIAPGTTSATQPCVYVVAEQPNSVVLELQVQDADARPRAVLVNCFVYEERENERGGDSNDGLEGIAWTGRTGQFYLVEEGTAPHSQTNQMLYFLKPRLMRCTLADARVTVDQSWSNNVTRLLHGLQTKSTHTLNEVCAVNADTLIAVDRNGGWIVAVDTQTQKVEPWLNLYDPGLLNLRQRLADFPGPRQMPYVSIEGLAFDADGDLWLIDDPAMPEAFHESCLVRLRDPPPLPGGRQSDRP